MFYAVEKSNPIKILHNFVENTIEIKKLSFERRK